ncbi:hypothetical protein PJP13_29645, partial [Mycobacterium kansasii]
TNGNDNDLESCQVPFLVSLESNPFASLIALKAIIYLFDEVIYKNYKANQQIEKENLQPTLFAEIDHH